MRFDLREAVEALREAGLEGWAELLPQQLAEAQLGPNKGKIPGWEAAFSKLPELPRGGGDLSAPRVSVGDPSTIDEGSRADLIDSLTEGLKGLHPWRKGPFSIFGVDVDPEWRSDLKWARVAPGLSPLDGRTVLDVGCGNGYYMLRLLGAGAKAVFGVDPNLLYLYQFKAITRGLADDMNAHLIPIGLEGVPRRLRSFDTTLSMGILYHRRSPFDHLIELRETLRSGGELLLETIVIEGGEGEVLVPDDRYAMMRNVWFLPSVPELVRWLRRAGFRDVRVLDVTATTPEEQRSTPWMTYDSLPDFLDPNDPTRTVEGHPAPLRASIVATAP